MLCDAPVYFTFSIYAYKYTLIRECIWAYPNHVCPPTRVCIHFFLFHTLTMCLCIWNSNIASCYVWFFVQKKKIRSLSVFCFYIHLRLECMCIQFHWLFSYGSYFSVSLESIRLCLVCFFFHHRFRLFHAFLYGSIGVSAWLWLNFYFIHCILHFQMHDRKEKKEYARALCTMRMQLFQRKS